MARCCFCGALSTDKISNRTFHRFPCHNIVLLKQWTANMNLKGLNITKYSVLCSDHFTDDCFDRSLFSVRLNKNSVPTKFDNPRSYCMYCRTKRTLNSRCSFFGFPTKNPRLLIKWLEKVGKKHWTPFTLLCSNHFEKSCFRKTTGKHLILKENSVPTIFNEDVIPTQFIDNQPSTENIEKIYLKEEHLDGNGVCSTKEEPMENQMKFVNSQEESVDENMEEHVIKREPVDENVQHTNEADMWIKIEPIDENVQHTNEADMWIKIEPIDENVQHTNEADMWIKKEYLGENVKQN